MRNWRVPFFGAIPVDGGVRFRAWAPAARELRVMVANGAARGEYSLQGQEGLFELTLQGAAAGDRYAYRVNGGRPLPDPASRFQPDGVHGLSEVIDPAAYIWHDAGWRGTPPSDLIIYELHVGTFSARGTFEGVTERLTALRDLGVTAIELMPLADFAGARNWGYDGVCLFAPTRVYGRPEELRALVDGAHAAGLSVILDVVYNHLGPEGAYLTQFNPQYLSESHHSPWGAAVNLDGPGAEAVRHFIIDSAVHWVREYHVDGLRLDATHALRDDTAPDRGGHIVQELAAAVRSEADRPVMIHAEDCRNLADIIDDRGWGLDAVWSDDFHHVARRLLAGDAHGYYADFTGTTSELADVLRQGWLFTGQYSTHHRKVRGSDPSRIPMRKFIVCLQNHDQVGNRAIGDRIHHRIDPASWRAASALLLMAPMTPLLFMGQEWAASTPFRYFTDLGTDFGPLVTKGRRGEFKDFPEFAAPGALEAIPDPQLAGTFEASRLRWNERESEPHGRVLELYRSFIALRRQHPALGASELSEGHAVTAGEDSVVVIRREDATAVFWIVVRLRGAGPLELTSLLADIPDRHALRMLLTTEEARFVKDPKPPEYDGATGRVRFTRPGAVVLTTDRREALLPRDLSDEPR